MGKMSMGRSNVTQVKQTQQKAPSAEVITQIIEKETIREIPVEHHHHHTKQITVNNEITKTRDSRARKYTKLLHKQAIDANEILQSRVDDLMIRQSMLLSKVEELQNKKPEEKQIVTIEKHNTEVIREVQTAIDKRLLVIIVASAILNIVLILIK